MHAGAETDPSDTINEIIFSTRKVRRRQVPLWRCALAAWQPEGWLMTDFIWLAINLWIA